MYMITGAVLRKWGYFACPFLTYCRRCTFCRDSGEGRAVAVLRTGSKEDCSVRSASTEWFLLLLFAVWNESLAYSFWKWQLTAWSLFSVCQLKMPMAQLGCDLSPLFIFQPCCRVNLCTSVPSLWRRMISLSPVGGSCHCEVLWFYRHR